MSSTTELVRKGLAKRYAKEKRFRLYGLLSITLSIVFLAILMLNIFSKGLPAFTSTDIKLEVALDPQVLGVTAESTPEQLRAADYATDINNGLEKLIPGVTERKQKKALKALVSSDAPYQLRDQVMADPKLIGTTQSLWLPADDEIDMYHKGYVDRTVPEAD
ncbi:MAG: DUF3333 domain-containing protein, partial [Thiotrichaceae bacterium]